MKNLRKMPWQPCCYYCNYYLEDNNVSYCGHRDAMTLILSKCEIEPTYVCDNYDDEISC